MEKKKSISNIETAKWVASPYLASDNIKGIMSVQINPTKFVIAKYPIKELEQIIKALKILEYDLIGVHFIFKEGEPLYIGEFDKEKNIITGLALAPIIDQE